MKILIFISAHRNVVLVHLAKVSCEAILEDFVVVMKRRVMLPVRFAGSFKYSFIHVKTQILSLFQYCENLISSMWNFLFHVLCHQCG